MTDAVAGPQEEPVAEKWIQIELPRLVEIDEVAIIPAQPVDAPDQSGVLAGGAGRTRKNRTEDRGTAKRDRGCV
ncbi:MAG: hypothetical protein ACC661_04140 [Verrucomicrobiales bacterium]